MIIGLVTHSARVTISELKYMARACELQLHHCAAEWERSPSHVLAENIPAYANLIHVFDDADTAGALGYHDQGPDGRPYGRVFVQPVTDAGGSVMDPKDGANTVSSVVSHEALELWGDPQCQLWAQGPDGYLYAVELCDQVEGDCYYVTAYKQRVPVSNWLCPAAFDPQPELGEPLDYMGTLAAPFTVAPNGYAIRMREGKVDQVWGEKGPLAWKLQSKMHPAARTARRGVVL